MPDTQDAITAPAIPAHLLDVEALKVIRHLRRSGFKAYLVGGCVRDLLLGRRPKDFDVATSAHPHQVKQSFRNCRLIGRRFRLAHIYYRVDDGGESKLKVIEVSTFRSNPIDAILDTEGQAEAGHDLLIRHDNVFGTEEEDARRRDFTINGLFYDVEMGRVLDYVEGQADLTARLVRTIGNPDVRMREDPVRILRAIRFAAKCGLALEPETLAAMKAHAPEIVRCAKPRIFDELLKLLRSGAAKQCLELMGEVGMLQILLPPLAAVFAAQPEALERQLRALAALDEHVNQDEIPSDAVLLAQLLSPLPRSGAAQGPIAKPPPAAQPAAAAADTSPDAVDPDAPEESDPDALEPELEALNRRLAEESAEDEGGEGGDDAERAGDAADGEDDDEAPEAADAEAASDRGDASAQDAVEEPPAQPEPAEASRDARPGRASLQALGELRDERLAASGIPTFSVGGEGDAAPWALPQGVVPAETVLSEMVRTARLPRRIAERARLILSLQGILAGGKKRRRFSPAQFVRESIFPEALAVFEMNAAAGSAETDALARWRELNAKEFYARLNAGVEIEPPREPERSGRRRRRGGRGRRSGKS